MVNELKGLEGFIPRNQQDRITLATLDMLHEINENIKSLAELLKPIEKIEAPVEKVKKTRVKKETNKQG